MIYIKSDEFIRPIFLNTLATPKMREVTSIQYSALRAFLEILHFSDVRLGTERKIQICFFPVAWIFLLIFKYYEYLSYFKGN